jgi:hypothetical protein
MIASPSQSSTPNRVGDATIVSPDLQGQLGLLAESIRLATPPAFFAVWQDGPDSLRLFVRSLGEAGLKFLHLIRPEILASNLKALEQRPSLLSDSDGIVFLGCLGALPDEERNQFNAARDRLLRLPTKMIFVESVTDERRVRLGFPDVLSQVSYDCRLFLRAGEEDPFATIDGRQTVSGQKADAPAPLSGTVHEVRADDAVCWLEIAPGTLVKFAVPLPLLRHLNPQPGLELLWFPGNEREAPRFWKPQPEPPDPTLLKEFEELSRRFHEDLKHRKRRSPNEVTPPHE